MLPTTSDPGDGTPVPRSCLNLYVVWAPEVRQEEGHKRDVSDGARLARQIYAHFCFENEDPIFGALGIPVYFRSVPAPHSGDGKPLPIDLGAAERSVVIVLVDAEMALSSSVWDPYVTAIASEVQASAGRHLLLPVALSTTALLLFLLIFST